MVGKGMAQSGKYFELPSGEKLSNLEHFPYNSIEVIDNRADTSYIFIERQLASAPQKINFNQPLSVVLNDYKSEKYDHIFTKRISP